MNIRILILAVSVLVSLQTPAFDVASVRRSNSRGGGAVKVPTWTAGHFVAENIPLFGLVWEAWGLQEQYQIETAISWVRTERYDIAATFPAKATTEQAHEMLQNLLAERFGLAVHHETRKLPGYRLAIAKGGPKLRMSAEGELIDFNGSNSVATKSGIRLLAPQAPSGMLYTAEYEQIHGRKATIAKLIHYLTQALRTPVIDATGIDGEYDFDLVFAPPESGPRANGDVVMMPPPVINSPAAASESGVTYPTLTAVIREQLRLQLDPDKALPTDVLVLDKANANPAGN